MNVTRLMFDGGPGSDSGSDLRPEHEAHARQERLQHEPRKVDQQERIADGVKSGELTAGEAAHLERHARSG